MTRPGWPAPSDHTAVKILIAGSSDRQLQVWTIYDHPTDFPNKFAARRFVYDKPTGDVITTDDIENLRTFFRSQGLTCLPRSESDDPVIVETWM